MRRLIIFLLLLPSALAANYTVCSSGCDFSDLTACLFQINETNSTCILNESGYWPLNGSWYFNFFSDENHSTIWIDTDDITLDCNQTWLINPLITVKGNRSSINRCKIEKTDCNFYTLIYLEDYFNINISDSFFNVSCGYDNEIDLFSKSAIATITNNIFLGDLLIQTIESKIVNNTINIWYFGPVRPKLIENNNISSVLELSLLWLENSIIKNNILITSFRLSILGSNSIISDNYISTNNNRYLNIWGTNLTFINNTFEFSKSEFYARDTTGENHSFINNTFRNCALEFRTNRSNFTGNLFLSSTLNLSGQNNSLWLNLFSNTSFYDNGIGTSFCQDGKGNFWEKGLPIPSGDCGHSEFTGWKQKYYNTLRLNWSEQSSPLPVHYDLYLKNEWDKLYFLDTLDQPDYTGPADVPAGNYTALLIPWVSGSRIETYPTETGRFEIMPVESIQFILKLKNPDILFWTGEKATPLADLGSLKPFSLLFLAGWFEKSLYALVFAGSQFLSAEAGKG